MSAMFDALFPDVPVPKNAWQWADSAQYRLLRGGAHRALSAVDLMICATAALRGLVVLHDDNDFATAAPHLTDLDERRVHERLQQSHFHATWLQESGFAATRWPTSRCSRRIQVLSVPE
jgi:hypothetical protein